MSTDVYQHLETRIRKNDLDALMARRECGRQLLAERGEAGRLPNGRLEELSNALDVSRSELNNRMRFAASHLTDEDVQMALKVYGSWFAICRDSLKARLTDDEPEEPDTPELKSKELYEALGTLQGKANRFLMLDVDDPLVDPILCDRRYLDPSTVKSLFNAFRELRNRLAVVMEALKQRMDARMVDPADFLSGRTLTDAIQDGAERSPVGANR
jgi:hypothetical protein